MTRGEAEARSVDVIVIGGGGAGLFAALSAAGGGARTWLVEKTERLGGATAWSVGTFAASGTRAQARKGIADTADQHAADTLAAGAHSGNRDAPELVALLARHASETLRQLEDLGVVFFGPLPNPAHRVARLHGVLPGSKAYIHHLEREVRKAGVRIVTGTAAVGLLQTGEAVNGVSLAGRVAGPVFASGGVVLACGDFSGDEDFKRRFCPPAVACADALIGSNTGDGHRMALAAGGHIVNGGVVSGPVLRFVPPPSSFINKLPPWSVVGRSMRWALDHLPERLLRPFLMSFLTTVLGPEKALFDHGAILVNNQGDRFVDEADRPELAIPAQPGKCAFIVFDDDLATRFSAWPHFVSTAPGVGYAYVPDYRRSRPDIYRTGANAEDLARAINLPAARLANALSAGEGNPPVRRPMTGRMHALGPVKSYHLVMEGGLAVSERLEVLREDGRPIPGLFAAGGTGQGGALLSGLGNHIAWAMTSGRLAGIFAAERSSRGCGRHEDD